MIPIRPQPAPTDFDDRVRNPGQRFLAEIPIPTVRQWEGREYWRRVLPDMSIAYESICAYCAHWIPHSTGNHSIDHFIPKSQDPQLAYEWSNFRYVAARFNSRKGTKEILDPFALPSDWFIIDFSSMFVKPGHDLSPHDKETVQRTITILKLNEDDDLVTEREAWVNEFRSGGISFSYLQKKAPFIAQELDRQGLRFMD